MTLGDAFPRGLVSASAVRQLRPGVVIKLLATLDDKKEKEKRFVVISVTDDVFTCVMNSEIHPLIANNPRTIKCQVAITEADHEFADRNCHFDCSKVFTFPRNDVVEQLTDNPSWVLGSIDENIKDQILGALKVSPLIAPKECASHCAALEDIEFD